MLSERCFSGRAQTYFIDYLETEIRTFVSGYFHLFPCLHKYVTDLLCARRPFDPAALKEQREVNHAL